MNTATANQDMRMPAGAGETMFVLDTTARPPKPVRFHEVLLDPDSGAVVPYEFRSNEYTEMPADHAMRFITNDAFIVKKTIDGPRLRPIAKRTDDVAQRLQPDECIANYDELTQEALLARAKSKPGSEAFKPGTRKRVLIDFLMGLRQKEEKPAAESAEADGAGDLLDPEDPELGDDELDDIMPKPPIPGQA